MTPMTLARANKAFWQAWQIRPEPMPDREHIQGSLAAGVFPHWHFVSIAIKTLAWRREERWHRRVGRALWAGARALR